MSITLTDAEREAILRIPIVADVECQKSTIRVTLKAFQSVNTCDDDGASEDVHEYTAGKVIFINTSTDPRKVIGLGFSHYHGNGTYICLGNIHNEVRELIEQKDWLAIINIMCEFVQCYCEEPGEGEEEDEEEEGCYDDCAYYNHPRCTHPEWNKHWQVPTVYCDYYEPAPPEPTQGRTYEY